VFNEKGEIIPVDSYTDEHYDVSLSIDTDGKPKLESSPVARSIILICSAILLMLLFLIFPRVPCEGVSDTKVSVRLASLSVFPDGRKIITDSAGNASGKYRSNALKKTYAFNEKGPEGSISLN
jgi:hypothetical protein